MSTVTIFYLSSVLQEFVLMSALAFIIMLVHALVRPVLNENDPCHQRKPNVASDGFIDVSDKEEETLDFSPRSSHRGLRSRAPLPGREIPVCEATTEHFKRSD
mmetsp:Transcript_25141/g.36970  ORF Transcript_25141/g.36970 Transcript_25141/m.36970 type:complete len:103 (-) Transcript_25141:282-590(-)|eukprot:CAMPEP_0195527098 /NCGR_PEP_ID=MMETSP0794_2-20130614/28552_1 /TAXON_ID=515487 /ORGANISM="Stephanopyxis turris, Strain CCMP 815" /LENGTH=102 /DNA_ID=CAMNT_0040657929 /DNA_START=646 /DNA_END=954 /DNA_ORIENTATION=+